MPRLRRLAPLAWHSVRWVSPPRPVAARSRRAPDRRLPPAGHRSRASRRRPAPPAATARRSGYLRGSIIVKFRPGTSAASAAIADGAAWAGDMAAPLSNADFDIVRLRCRRRPRGRGRAAQRAARCRVRAGALPRAPDVRAERPALLAAVELSRHRHGARVGHQPRRHRRPSPSRCSTAASPTAARCSATTRIALAARQDGVASRRSGTLDIPFAAAPDLAGADRFVVAARLHLGRHRCRSTSTATARTSRARSDSSPTTASASRAWRSTSASCRSRSSTRDWDDIFDSPFVGTDDVVARGMRYAVDNGAKVINMSIGRTGPPAPVVAGAPSATRCRAARSWPSRRQRLRERQSRERLAEFAPADRGHGGGRRHRPRPAARVYSSAGPYIELVAPGGDFARSGGTTGRRPAADVRPRSRRNLRHGSRVALPGAAVRRPSRTTSSQGTSMAAPHVAGFAALLMQQGITSPAAIEAIMKQFATDLGPAGRDDQYGYGLINPRAVAARHGAGEVRRAWDTAGRGRCASQLAPGCASSWRRGGLQRRPRRSRAGRPTAACAQTRRGTGRPGVRVRAFGEAGVRRFTSAQTFEAVLGSSIGPLFGGGVEVLWGRHLSVDLGVSRYRATRRARVRLERRGLPVGHRNHRHGGADGGHGGVPLRAAPEQRDPLRRRRHQLAPLHGDLRLRRRRRRRVVHVHGRARAGRRRVARLEAGGRGRRRPLVHASATRSAADHRAPRQPSASTTWAAFDATVRVIIGRLARRQRSAFARRVLAAVRRIPPGAVATYGDIARLAGVAAGRAGRRVRHARLQRPVRRPVTG